MNGLPQTIAAPSAGGWPRLPSLDAVLGRRRGVARLLRFAALTASALARDSRAESADPAEATAFGHALARRIVDGLDISLEVTGERPHGLFLLVANHRSYMDIPALLSLVPAIYLAKEEIGSWPLVGTAARAAHTIFVDRDSRPSRKRALRTMKRHLLSGVPVALFPEGTTTRGPGALPFRPGSFWLAATLGVPVAPVAISYEDPANAWIDDDPFVGHFVRQLSAPRVTIRIAFGPALRGTDGFELRDAARSWIRGSLWGGLAPAA